MRGVFSRGMACLLLLIAVAGGVDAGPTRGERPEVWRILRLMREGRHTTYEGLQTVELYAGEKQATSRARIAQLNGWVRTEILAPERLKGMLMLEQGAKGFVRHRGLPWQSRVGNPPQEPRKLLRNYTVTLLERTRLAGRPAVVLQFRSRAWGKIARKLWVDQETGVVLRAEAYNWAGVLVSSTELESIDYSPTLDAEDFRPPQVTERFGNIQGPVPEDAQEALPSPKYLPAGYEMAGPSRWVKTQRGNAAHSRYTDGLNALSVFVRRMRPDEPRRTRELPITERGLSNVTHLVKDGYRITIIGDLPPEELRRVAESME